MAIFFRQVHTKEAQFAHPPNGVERERVGAVPGCSEGGNLRLGEAADRVGEVQIQFLLDRMKRVDTNQEFLDSMAAGG